MKRTFDNSDLSVIYYTSNFLETANPYFLANTKRILLESLSGAKLISVSQKPCDIGENLCVGDIGRSNRNIYWQILQGAKAAKTKYVAMAEDDVLYTADHVAIRPKRRGELIYDMSKWSMFTWSRPQLFSWRDRKIMLGLVGFRDDLVESLEERLQKFPAYDNQFCGEPGRWDEVLQVKRYETPWCWGGRPLVVFSHPHALGYVSTPYGRTHAVGERKAHGPLRGTFLDPWGYAKDVMKFWDPDYDE